MLAKIFDRVLNSFGYLRSKIDEILLSDAEKRIRSLWRVYRAKHNPYLGFTRIAAVDSGYNILEFRGFALYAVSTVWVLIGEDIGEECDGLIDIDISSSSMLESELSLLSILMEFEAIEKIASRADLVLVDGSLIAKSHRLVKALNDGSELLKEKGISVQNIVLDRLTTIFTLSRKIVFLSKNSTSKDILSMVKGDVYYFERYTDGLPGYSSPLYAVHARYGLTVYIARFLESISKDRTGVTLKPIIAYVRFTPNARVYRLEILVEDLIEAEDRIKHFMNIIEPFTIEGYPYPLMRADSLARISHHDLEALARILGVAQDPYSREPLRRAL